MMHNTNSSVKANFFICIKKIRTIAHWAVLASIMEILTNFLIQYASGHRYTIAYVGIALVIASWLLATFFVLPLMAVHHQNLIALIGVSARMCKEKIGAILGGECWFALMIMLVATPFFFVWLLVSQPSLNPLLPALGLLSAEILVKCWIATAHNIFKMVLLFTPPTPEN
jgi:hypothetical protein